MKNIDGTDVVVMKGSYSYVGADGQTWTVDWYADETGYHPSAPFLPKSVEPIHPEIKAELQQRFFEDIGGGTLIPDTGSMIL